MSHISPHFTTVPKSRAVHLIPQASNHSPLTSPVTKRLRIRSFLVGNPVLHNEFCPNYQREDTNLESTSTLLPSSLPPSYKSEHLGKSWSPGVTISF